jgi:putative transposase
MGRKPRVYVPGQSVHLIRRGINRCQIFRDDVDRRVFLLMVKEAGVKCGTAFHAYVLMDTHYHALATPLGPEALSDTAKVLNECYVKYFNRKYDRIGTLWTNRPTGVPIDTERYWLTCLRYIEQNPVRAGMVREPADYRWSSFRAHALGERIDWLVEHEVYRALGRTAEERQVAYRAICGVPLTEEELALHRNPGLVHKPSAAASEIAAAL